MNPMTDEEVERKFLQLIEPRYGQERADKILAACWKLEQLKSAADLMALLSL
jgi:2-methylcitrate dehydratase PrpD